MRLQKTHLVITLLLCLAATLNAQTIDNIEDDFLDEECQTVYEDGFYEWYIDYMRDVAYPYIKEGIKENAEPVEIPLVFNVFRNDDGSFNWNTPNGGTLARPALTDELIDENITLLNQLMEGTNIEYYRFGEVNYVNMSGIYSPDYSCVVIDPDSGEEVNVRCPRRGGSAYLAYSSFAININVGIGTSNQALPPEDNEIDNYDYCTSSARNVVFVGSTESFDLIRKQFPHELGHRFGLMHIFTDLLGSKFEQCVFEGASPDCTPATCISPDVNSPYRPKSNRTAPLELIIREDDPSKPYPCKNWDVTADLLEDTPAIPQLSGRGSTEFWKGLANTDCDPPDPDCARCIETTLDANGVRTYIGSCRDYNGDVYSGEDANIGARNIMNYGPGRTEFTDDQKGLMSNWSLVHQQNLSRYPAGAGFDGSVYFQNTKVAMPLVSLFLDGPEEESYCRVVTRTDGSFNTTMQGYFSRSRSNIQIQTLGSGDATTNAIAAKCEPIIIYEYTDEDWLAGVDMSDVQLIQDHVNSTTTLLGFNALAADVNMDAQITQADVDILTQALVGRDLTALRQVEKPWYFVPEEIVFLCPKSFNNDPFDLDASCFPNSYNRAGAPSNEYVTYSYPYQLNLKDLQHFLGYKLGDVNGSAVNNIPNLAPSKTFSAPEKTFVLESLKKDEVVLSPNPTQGAFTLKFLEEAEVHTVTIYNPNGKVVRVLEQPKEVQTRSISLDLGEQLSGIYIVKIALGTHTIMKKIVKQ